MLTDTEIRRAQARGRKYSMSDIRGLHVEIMPSGRKFFRLRYSRDSKKSWFTIGEFPAVSLDAARDETIRLQGRLKDGLPLGEVPEAAPSVLFRDVAAEWADYNDTRNIAVNTKAKTRNLLQRFIMPVLGNRRIDDITPPDVLSALQPIAAKGKFVTANHVKAAISHIFQFAAAKGLVMYDPCALLRGAISAPAAVHHRSLRSPADVADLLNAVNAYSGQRIRLAAMFSIYSFCRPGEMCRAEWCEIDIDRAEWRIPPEKMKKRRAHIVPLSTQLLAILGVMRRQTAHCRYIFPDFRSNDDGKHIGVSSVRFLLRTIGFLDRITPHGFRSMASTILNENGFNRDWIERQLAHVEGNSVRAAYNYADWLAERRRMVQWYGDYLDGLMDGPMNLG